MSWQKILGYGIIAVILAAFWILTIVLGGPWWGFLATLAGAAALAGLVFLALLLIDEEW